MLTNWNDKKVLLVESNTYTITEDVFKKGYHLSLSLYKNDKTVTEYIEKWYNNSNISDLIIKNKESYFLLEKGFPKNIIIGFNKNITSGEFRFNTLHNISRQYKIHSLLNS